MCPPLCVRPPPTGARRPRPTAVHLSPGSFVLRVCQTRCVCSRDLPYLPKMMPYVCHRFDPRLWAHRGPALTPLCMNVGPGGYHWPTGQTVRLARPASHNNSTSLLFSPALPWHLWSPHTENGIVPSDRRRASPWWPHREGALAPAHQPPGVYDGSGLRFPCVVAQGFFMCLLPRCHLPT